MGIHQFICDGCSEEVIAYRQRKPKFCSACTDMRYAVSTTSRTRQPKFCKGCNIRMLNVEYGGRYVCNDCTTIRERRHNGWSDPYSKPMDFIAANDNSPTKVCASCEWELPHDAFTQGFGVCKDCRCKLREHEDRTDEYAARVRPEPTADDIARRILSRRIRIIDCANRRRLAEKRAMGRKIDAYLKRWRDWQERPWLRPGLSKAEYYRLRYAHDNEYMLRERTRQRIRRKGFGFNVMWRMRQSLYGQVGERGTATIEQALGYSMSDLRIHLESQFTDGMSWDAFRSGCIHIDHKKPISRFNLDDPAQVLEAWSLDNLQPLWAEDNMAKGAKTDEEWRAAA